MIASCKMGAGCESYGVCYAEAHGQPDQCPHHTPNTVEVLERLLAAVDALELRKLVAGWNGENRADGPYEPHPSRLGVTLRTNAGQVYDLDAAAEQARDAIAKARGEA